MDQVDNAVGEIGREVGAVVGAAVLAETARDVYARPALSECELHVRISLVVAEKNVETRLTLFDQVVLESESLFIVGDDDIVHVDGFAYQRSCLCVFPAAFVEVAGDAAAQILGFSHIDHIASGVLVEIHARLGGNGSNLLEEIHGGTSILFDGRGSAVADAVQYALWVRTTSVPAKTLRLA